MAANEKQAIHNFRTHGFYPLSATRLYPSFRLFSNQVPCHGDGAQRSMKMDQPIPRSPHRRSEATPVHKIIPGAARVASESRSAGSEAHAARPKADQLYFRIN